ncbi:MAG: dihydroorotase [Xenococcaceae cyanobacterium MO_188.B32]|nr:dihydroorotase [Xenococcaceae cyanobacterium MO_188.B32]
MENQLNQFKKILLRQAKVVDPVARVDRVGDVLIIDAKIKQIQPFITDFPKDTQEFDAKNLVVAPGLVDIYSYSSDPGYEYRESFITLASAAFAGGFTRLNILPNIVPPIDNLEVLSSMQQKSLKLKSDLVQSFPDLQFWGAMGSSRQNQRQMTDLIELSANVVGFAETYTFASLGLLKQILEYVKPLNKPIALAINNNELKGKGVVREGTASISYGLSGEPAFAEAAAIAAVLEIVDAIGTPVHMMRISTRRGVELIANAKQRGVPVTASTTWMHLLFNTQDLNNYDPNLRLDPPLGNEDDMLALIQGVKQGVIDAIAIDHTPYTYEEKTLAFAEAPPGVIGLELALPLLWSRFVKSGEWTALELWQALSTRPQQCLQQNPSSLTSQAKTELVLFDPHKNWVVERNSLKSQASNTPWWGKEITGKVVNVWNS